MFHIGARAIGIAPTFLFFILHPIINDNVASIFYVLAVSKRSERKGKRPVWALAASAAGAVAVALPLSVTKGEISIFTAAKYND